MLPDDHPWPELGSVTRGATRGNQGSKGSLSLPGSDGRCVLQLRVQPGVLAVTLTRQASEWYRTLDDAVTSALKLTKGYWRKARRRQDYDAQADQDHIELNEWLQQLKDKVMAHLEMLIAKGEIRGPPYAMSDDQEFTFLRKFIERQAAGVPHNPRLRGVSHENRTQSSNSLEMPRSETPEDSKALASFHDDNTRLLESEEHNVPSSTSSLTTQTTMRPPPQSRIASLLKDAQSNKQEIETARRTLTQARKDAQLAFQKYSNLLDAERRAQNALTTAEERRGELMSSFIDFYNTYNTTFSTDGSPIPADSRPNTSPFPPPQMLPSSHHSMSSPSFATTSRHTVPSPLTTWDTDRQERSTSAFNNGATVVVNQFADSDRQGHWAQHDTRINMNGNGLNHPDATAMRQTLQTAIPIAQGFMPQMSVGRNRKHGRDWGYGEMEEHSADHEDLTGISSRKRPHQMGGSLRVQTVSDGLHMVSPPDESLSASQPSHLSAPQSHFRDAPA